MKAPYLWFVDQNSSSKTHFLQTDILMWANDGILRIMQMIGSITLLATASITLLYISPIIGVIGILIVLLFSILIISLTKSKISSFSEIRRISNTKSLTIFNQILEGLKILK